MQGHLHAPKDLHTAYIGPLLPRGHIQLGWVLSRGGIAKVLNTILAMYWQKTYSPFFSPAKQASQRWYKNICFQHTIDAYTILWHKPPKYVGVIFLYQMKLPLYFGYSWTVSRMNIDSLYLRSLGPNLWNEVKVKCQSHVLNFLLCLVLHFFWYFKRYI